LRICCLIIIYCSSSVVSVVIVLIWVFSRVGFSSSIIICSITISRRKTSKSFLHNII
jgi:hypothetical protein